MLGATLQAVDVHAGHLSVEGLSAAGGNLSPGELLRDADAEGVPQHELQGDVQLHRRNGS